MLLPVCCYLYMYIYFCLYFQLCRDDTLVPKYTLDGIDLQDLKRETVTDSKFIKVLTRRLYSIYERAPNCNVMGRSHRGSISPQKRRYELLCKEAAPYLSGRLDLLEREALIRMGIDTTNRNYRDELRQRKRRMIVQQEEARAVNEAAAQPPPPAAAQPPPTAHPALRQPDPMLQAQPLLPAPVQPNAPAKLPRDAQPQVVPPAPALVAPMIPALD